MNKNYGTKIFYYNHFIAPFIADTVHLNVDSKYAYLTLIWESHEKQGAISEKHLTSLMMRNKEISKETYSKVLEEFWEETEDGYTNSRIILDIQAINKHKNKSSEGGKSSALQTMINSDKNINEYAQIFKLYKGKKLHKTNGVENYCKAKLKSKEFTFENVLLAVKSLNKTVSDLKYYPMMSTFFNDKDDKYWKADNSDVQSNNYMKGIKWICIQT